MRISVPLSRVSPIEDEELGVLSELEEQKENFLDSTSNAPFPGNTITSDLRSSPHVSFPSVPSLSGPET